MLSGRLRRLALGGAISGAILLQTCSLYVDPFAAVAVANALSRCDYEFDDDEFEIECGDRWDDRHDDWWWGWW